MGCCFPPLYKWMFRGHPLLLWVTHNNCAVRHHTLFPCLWTEVVQRKTETQAGGRRVALPPFFYLLTPQASTNKSLVSCLLSCSRSWFWAKERRRHLFLCATKGNWKSHSLRNVKCSCSFFFFFLLFLCPITKVGRLCAHRTSFVFIFVERKECLSPPNVLVSCLLVAFSSSHLMSRELRLFLLLLLPTPIGDRRRYTVNRLSQRGWEGGTRRRKKISSNSS